MKEARVWDRPNNQVEVDTHDIPVPTPGPNQVLIKVAVSGSNPKDWKFPAWMEDRNGSNSGDDIAGVVSEVGDSVTHFRPGDRVAAFHKMRTAHGSFAEYAIAEEHCTFSLPKGTSFEEGATLPLAAMTAVIGLFSRLGIPEPWNKGREDRDVVSFPGTIPCVSNLTARPYMSKEEVEDLLARQAVETVQWWDSIRYLDHELGVRRWIGLGPGKVGRNLVGKEVGIRGKDVVKGAGVWAITTPEDIDEVLRGLEETDGMVDEDE